MDLLKYVLKECDMSISEIVREEKVNNLKKISKKTTEQEMILDQKLPRGSGRRRVSNEAWWCVENLIEDKMLKKMNQIWNNNEETIEHLEPFH